MSAPAEEAADIAPAHHEGPHAHHFDSMEEQADATKLGVWLFLVTEILLFGGLFCAFAIFRAKYLDAFVEAHHHLDRTLGIANTIVLLTSSLSMALAVRAAQTNQRRKSALLLGVTIGLAAIFLVVKFFEYSHKFHEGLLPGIHFTAQGFAHAEAALFFGIYFMMTGIHGIHVLAGMGLIAWILVRTRKQEFSSENYTAVEGVGLYWHLVDLVWIYLFPLLYLVG